VDGKLYVIAGGADPSKPASSANEIFEP
jgi:hypothetical protein